MVAGVLVALVWARILAWWARFQRQVTMSWVVGGKESGWPGMLPRFSNSWSNPAARRVQRRSLARMTARWVGDQPSWSRAAGSWDWYWRAVRWSAGPQVGAAGSSGPPRSGVMEYARRCAWGPTLSPEQRGSLGPSSPHPGPWRNPLR